MPIPLLGSRICYQGWQRWLELDPSANGGETGVHVFLPHRFVFGRSVEEAREDGLDGGVESSVAGGDEFDELLHGPVEVH